MGLRCSGLAQFTRFKPPASRPNGYGVGDMWLSGSAVVVATSSRSFKTLATTDQITAGGGLPDGTTARRYLRWSGSAWVAHAGPLSTDDRNVLDDMDVTSPGTTARALQLKRYTVAQQNFRTRKTLQIRGGKPVTQIAGDIWIEGSDVKVRTGAATGNIVSLTDVGSGGGGGGGGGYTQLTGTQRSAGAFRLPVKAITTVSYTALNAAFGSNTGAIGLRRSFLINSNSRSNVQLCWKVGNRWFAKTASGVLSTATSGNGKSYTEISYERKVIDARLLNTSRTNALRYAAAGRGAMTIHTSGSNNTSSDMIIRATGDTGTSRSGFRFFGSTSQYGTGPTVTSQAGVTTIPPRIPAYSVTVLNTEAAIRSLEQVVGVDEGHIAFLARGDDIIAKIGNYWFVFTES